MPRPHPLTSSRLFHSSNSREIANRDTSSQFDTFTGNSSTNTRPSTIPKVFDGTSSTMMRQEDYLTACANMPSPPGQQPNQGHPEPMDDNASLASTTSTIFDGLTGEDITETREQRKLFSREVRRFEKLYHAAKMSNDPDDQNDADMMRPRLAQMAERLVDYTRRRYPAEHGKDFFAKQRMRDYLMKVRDGYVARQPFFVSPESTHLFPDPADIMKKPTLGKKRLGTDSFATTQTPAKSAKASANVVDEIRLNPPEAEVNPQINAVGEVILGAVGGTHSPVGTPKQIQRGRSRTKKTPPAGTPKTGVTPLQLPRSGINKQHSPAVNQRYQELVGIQASLADAQNLAMQQEAEKKKREHELNERRRELEEERRAVAIANKKEEEEREERARREKEKQEEKKKRILDASIEQATKAYEAELRRVARNEEELERMAEAARQIEEMRAKEAEEAMRPRLPSVAVVDEDELELGAESTSFHPVPSKKKRTPPKKIPATHIFIPATSGGLPIHAAATRVRVGTSPTPAPAPAGASPRDAADSHHRELLWIQTQQLAQTYAQNARPAKLFESGSSSDFALLMGKFDLAANTKGMDARAKLLELSNWLAGAPKLIVDAEASEPDAELAYARARSELTALFGRNDDATAGLMRLISAGKPVAENDRDQHITFYAQLKAVQATAKSATSEGDFDRQDVLRKVIDRKVPHLRVKFWKKDEKARGKGLPRLKFKDLLEVIQNWSNILSAAGEKEVTAKVAATVTQPASSSTPSPPERTRGMSYAETVAKSPPMQQPTSRCGVCTSFHETVDCAALAKLEPDAKVKKLKEKGLCFHCLSSGHEARQCTAQKPRCIICHRNHHSILHGRSFPTPAPRLSAGAKPFHPVANAATSSTTQNHAAPSTSTSSSTSATATSL